MPRTALLIVLSGTLIAAGGAPLVAQPAQQSSLPVLAADRAPGVDVWLDNDFFQVFSDAKAYFNAAPGSYVTVIRVTSRNTLQVLYPASPSQQAPYVRTPEARSEIGFRTDAKEGLGLLYAISSDRPFDYSRVSDRGNWKAGRLSNPTGANVPEIAGYFFNEIIPSSGMRYTMAQAPYVNGGAVFRLGAPGFPTVSSVIDAAGLACAWSGTDTEGRVCGNVPIKPRVRPPPPAH